MTAPIYTPDEAIKLANDVVLGQNFYSIGGGGSVGLLAAIWHVSNRDDCSETLTDTIAGVGGGVLGQSIVFYIASREPVTNSFFKFFQDQCIWLLKTPLPAIVGAAGTIGIRFLINSRQS